MYNQLNEEIFSSIIKPKLDEGLEHLKQHFLQIRESEGVNILISKVEYIELLVSSFLLYSWTRDYDSYNSDTTQVQQEIENYIMNFLETKLN